MSYQKLDLTSPGGGTFTVPAAVKAITAYVIGGGGGGGNGGNGGGGGGGGWATKSYSTTPGTTYSYTIGAAGAGDSSDGGDTSFNNGGTPIVATGGVGSFGSTGGTGGNASGPYDSSAAGGDGGNGVTCCGSACVDCQCICDDPPACTTCTDTCVDINDCGCADYAGGGGGAGSSSGAGSNATSADCNCTGSCGINTYCCNDGVTGTGGASLLAWDNEGGSGSGATGNTDATNPGGGGGGNNRYGGTGAIQISWQAGHLTITTQPTNTIVNATMANVVVEVRYNDDTLASGYTGPVTIAINNNPGGGTLSGTTTKNAVAGVATFDDLSINAVGTAYTLDITASDIDSATSSAFNITSVPPLSVNINDSATVTESVGAARIFCITTNDQVSVAESLASRISDIINLSDAVAVTEMINVVLAVAFSPNLFDDSTISESTTVRLTNSMQLVDAVSTTESVALLVASAISISDTLSVSEFVQTLETDFISVNDTIIITEQVGYDLSVIVHNDITISDYFNGNIALNVCVMDDVVLSEIEPTILPQIFTLLEATPNDVSYINRRELETSWGWGRVTPDGYGAPAYPLPVNPAAATVEQPPELSEHISAQSVEVAPVPPPEKPPIIGVRDAGLLAAKYERLAKVQRGMPQRRIRR